MSYSIKLATDQDSEEVLRLYKSLVGSEYCAWTDEYPDDREISFDLSRDALFVMRDKDELVASISIDLDEEVEALSCWSKELEPGAELSRLAVNASYQNRGLAREMMVYAFDILKERGYKSVHLLVAKDNIKALNSYNKLGYNNVGETVMFGHEYWCYEKALV